MKQLKTIPTEYKLLFALMLLMAVRLLSIVTIAGQYFFQNFLSR